MPKKQSRVIPLVHIVDMVCTATGTTRDQIKSQDKRTQYVFARVLITHNARKNGYSLKLISYALNKTEAAILNHLKIYQRLSFRDKEFLKYRDLSNIMLYS